MPSRLQSFCQVGYPSKFPGHPRIASVSQNEVVVSDWSGNLYRIVLAPFEVRKMAFVAIKVGEVPVCNILCSLAPSAADPVVCAVATRGNRAAVWNSAKSDVVHIIPDCGLVGSVAWFGDTEYLLLGTGHYSLTSGVRPQARIELWKPNADEPSCLNRIALPGCSVDAIAVQLADNQIIVFSGMEAQNQGFISVLEANTFSPQAVFDLPFAMVGRMECTEDLIFICHSGEVDCIYRSDGTVRWSHEIPGQSVDFAYDPHYHQLLLSNGELISARNGQLVETWPVLTDCCCVNPRPEGGFVGVSTAGIIGIWNVNS